MNVTTIEMDKKLAREKFEEYRAAVQRKNDAADRILMKTYKQLAEGKQLINIVDVIREAGVDEYHRPVFAIARADATHVWYSKDVHSQTNFRVNRFSTYNGPAYEEQATNHNIDFHRDIFPMCPVNCEYLKQNQIPHPRDNRQRLTSHPHRLRAMVPIIPPHLRPANHLRNYHILWDVKGAWEFTPPRDPFLLKHVHGDLYAVLAVWDLTDLEMLVLKGLRGNV